MTAFLDSGRQPKDIPLDSIETRIFRAEHMLGIQTKAQRLLEATLVIDKPFFDLAIITGKPNNPERLFGDEEWAGYLNGRRLAREYGNKPLTIEFITDIHQAFLRYTHPDVKTSITDSKNPRGGELTAGTLLPIPVTEAQLKELRRNPSLQWQPDEDILFIPYGHIGYTVKTREERLEKLQEICGWYNAERRNGDLNPYALAARLQHRVISLHPLTTDYSGRVSRILMNWSLENDNLPPSALQNFDDDIFTHEADWAKAVKAGSERYTENRNRGLSNSEEDYVGIFDLTEEYTFYRKHSDHLYPPPTLVVGAKHSSRDAKQYMDTLRSYIVNDGTILGCNCEKHAQPTS